MDKPRVHNFHKYLNSQHFLNHDQERSKSKLIVKFPCYHMHCNHWHSRHLSKRLSGFGLKFDSYVTSNLKPIFCPVLLREPSTFILQKRFSMPDWISIHFSPFEINSLILFVRYLAKLSQPLIFYPLQSYIVQNIPWFMFILPSWTK